MSTKWRRILFVAIIVVVALEIGLRFAVRSKALVEIANNGTAPIQNLRIVCAGEETGIPPIEPGKRGSVYVTARTKGAMLLTFRQVKSALSTINIPDFDAPELEATRQKFVIEMADDGYRPVTEDTGEAEGNLAERALMNIKRWLASLP
jgi:hypothetical protein